MTHIPRAWGFGTYVIFITGMLCFREARAQEGPERDVHTRTFTTRGPANPSLSRPLRDLPRAGRSKDEREEEREREGEREREEHRFNPLAGLPDQGRRGTWDRKTLPPDPLAASAVNPLGRTPDVDLNIEGNLNDGGCCAPPDTNGDVGPGHYVQIVNITKFEVFDKSGALLAGPSFLNLMWAEAERCHSANGDPVVLYDPMADRWLISQFAPQHHLCVAISQSADPTGSYFLYEFDVGAFPDYFKFGAWPDGYYMSAAEGSYTAYVFERSKMLAGLPAMLQKFTGETNFMVPGDVDGPVPPPSGAPGYFFTYKDDSFHAGGPDRIEIREFHTDWAEPANSTFTLTDTVPVAAYTYAACGFFNFDCVNQPDTPQKLDAVTEWPMYRFPYRNFGTHQSLAGTFTVGGAANGPGGTGEIGAAPRWFELRKTTGGWALHREGTFDPADGHDRFMGSVAMDRLGDIALAYSVSSDALYPSIRYSTRLATDPDGTLGPEKEIQAGLGSQTGSNRWGDYSTMSVDPSNDCTFWYTNQYYRADPNEAEGFWHTRIAAFSIPECLASLPTALPTAIPTPGASSTPTASQPPASTHTPTNAASVTPVPTQAPTSTPTPPAAPTSSPTNSPGALATATATTTSTGTDPATSTPAAPTTGTPGPALTSTATPTAPLGDTPTSANTPTATEPTASTTATSTPAAGPFARDLAPASIAVALILAGILGAISLVPGRTRPDRRHRAGARGHRTGARRP